MNPRILAGGYFRCHSCYDENGRFSIRASDGKEILRKRLRDEAEAAARVMTARAKVNRAKVTYYVADTYAET